MRLLVVCAVLTLFVGCDAEDPGSDTTMLMIRLEPRVGQDALIDDPTTVYTINGQAMTIESARLYLSEITLLADNGDEVTFKADPITLPAKDAEDNTVTHTVDDRVILFKHDDGHHVYELGEVPAGVYNGVRFKVGIDGLTNRVDPTQAPTGHPLAVQTDKGNHWSWNAGYIYIRMDGHLDLDGDGTPESSEDAQWFVHLGTPNFLRQAEVGSTFTLQEGHMQELHILADYARFIQDVDYSDPTQRDCHTGNNLPVANKVGDQIGNAFTFHGLHTVEDDDHHHGDE
jgi:hypothetical protein